jgi:hypothetical protein
VTDVPNVPAPPVLTRACHRLGWCCPCPQTSVLLHEYHPTRTLDEQNMLAVLLQAPNNFEVTEVVAVAVPQRLRFQRGELRFGPSLAEKKDRCGGHGVISCSV